MEVWKDVKGYEGIYKVSNLGNVKSLNYNHSKKEKILKPCSVCKNYQQVILVKDKTRKHKLVHRLVAEAFIDNANNYPCVNHKDENPSNNCVDNLEWCTEKYNTNYGKCKEKIGKSNTNHVSFSKKVIQVETGIVFPSIMEAQRQTGIFNQSIVNVCKGKRQRAGNYHWKYYNNEAV